MANWMCGHFYFLLRRYACLSARSGMPSLPFQAGKGKSNQALFTHTGVRIPSLAQSKDLGGTPGFFQALYCSQNTLSALSHPDATTTVEWGERVCCVVDGEIFMN